MSLLASQIQGLSCAHLYYIKNKKIKKNIFFKCIQRCSKAPNSSRNVKIQYLVYGVLNNFQFFEGFQKSHGGGGVLPVIENSI